MKKYVSLVMVAILSIALLAACGSDKTSGSGDKHVTIGAKNYTEQYLLSKITGLYLEDNGFTVDEKSDLGSTALRKALLNEQVDFTWEYTGTALVTYLKQDPIADAQESFDAVKKMDKEKNDLGWINLTDVNNTYGLIMTEKDAKALGIKSISDLAAYINDHPGELTMGTDAEFANRSDGLKGVEKTYGFSFGQDNIKQMKAGIQYKALKQGEIDVAMSFSTDSRIDAFNLRLLEDDKQFFPGYYAAVSIRQPVLDKYPKLKDLTADIAEKLDSKTMRELNYKVDIDGKQVKEVAKQWLLDNGLLSN
ncbi:ABC transporter substrate-binding protein [Tuberibacillus sp. Marseille-P3662]|uniref:ABC transporter substrate-binding protein n=1 Tax=Tuberibacillus sp. Marseille-P3662 TaxID=1965358 RepID=UPI000A1C8CEE|nr:glycine betaine ABC transporter substrate-binding protein [Tuberibacillus sp. Marseille-P3662]